ncbi:MAG TPA: hypothetical protein VLT45_13810 [Kofleriaceae bacterium]|nr:hypothetical protein [Kofleriaceae bacterium]
MVKILALLVALCAVAHADDDIDSDVDNGPPLLLGFRLAAGKLPVATEDLTTLTLGLDVDHPVSRSWRVFGEYEWMWLDRDQMSTQHGSGHRLLTGLRHTVADKREGRLRAYLDVEGGGGLAVLDDSILGVRILPTGFAGLRGGYDFTHADSPSRVFEVEILVRAIFVENGTGLLAGFGMQWGN